MGAHRSPLIVDKSGHMEDSKVKGSGSRPPSQTLPPIPQPQDPRPSCPQAQTCAGHYCQQEKWSDIHPCVQEIGGGRGHRSHSLDRSKGRWSRGGGAPKRSGTKTEGPPSALWEAGGWVWGSAIGHLSLKVQSGSLRFGLSLRPELEA